MRRPSHSSRQWANSGPHNASATMALTSPKRWVLPQKPPRSWAAGKAASIGTVCFACPNEILSRFSTLSMLRQLNNYRKTSLTKNRNMNGPSFSYRTLQPPLPWSLDAHENQSSVTHATVSTMPNRRPTRRRDHQFASVVAGFSPQQRDLFRKSPKLA
jgi:hypothetical protein